MLGRRNFSIWLHRFYRHPQFGTQLAPLGTMGTAFRRVAAARLDPKRPVLCFAHAISMTGRELATAMQYGLAPKVFVIDNGTYVRSACMGAGVSRRVFGTDLRNPDFAMYARSFGADGFTINDDKGRREGDGAGLRSR